MTCREAAETSMTEYRLRVEGYQQRQRQEWEKARWQMFLAMQMHPYIKKKPSTPQDWIPFEWEKKQRKEVDPSVYRMTEADKEKLAEIFGRKNKEKGNG
jgi:hypothetical protein